jgi:hypothetical protein
LQLSIVTIDPALAIERHGKVKARRDWRRRRSRLR